MNNPTKTGVYDKNFNAKKDFLINAEYADAATHFHIVN